MSTSAKARRYREACERYHEARNGSDEVDAAWQALPLGARLREILCAPWRDAVHEVLAAWGLARGPAGDGR